MDDGLSRFNCANCGNPYYEHQPKHAAADCKGFRVKPPSALELEEGERQMLLLALAHLAVERRGWGDALHRIAVRIDNVKDGRAVMYDEFRALHRRAVVAADTIDADFSDAIASNVVLVRHTESQTVTVPPSGKVHVRFQPQVNLAVDEVRHSDGFRLRHVQHFRCEEVERSEVPWPMTRLGDVLELWFVREVDGDNQLTVALDGTAVDPSSSGSSEQSTTRTS